MQSAWCKWFKWRQLAGGGGKGRKGSDKPNAQADDTDGFGKAQFTVAQGKTPGMDGHGKFTRTNVFSGSGGDAGLAGLGGEARLAGDIVITDSKNTIRLLADQDAEFSGDVAEQLALTQLQRESGEQEATVQDRKYEEAPVSSLFLYNRRQDLAFEKPVGETQRNAIMFDSGRRIVHGRTASLSGLAPRRTTNESD